MGRWTERRLALLLAGLAGLGLVALAAATLGLPSRADAVPDRQARWVIARVHTAVFGPTALQDFGCFTLRPGRATARIFVVDASYTNYQTVDCESGVRRAGRDYLLTIKELWDDRIPPDDPGPIGWVQRLFYHQAYHSWAFRVHQDGTVITLPEGGQAAPQSYYH